MAEETKADAANIDLPVKVQEGPPEDTSAYDLCIVIPLHLNKTTDEYELIDKDVLHMLERIIQSVGRNFIYMYDSYYHNQRFVLLHGNSTRLRGKADSMRTPLLLDKEICEAHGRKGDRAKNINPIVIVHREEVTEYEPFEYLHARYVMNKDLDRLYAKHDLGDGRPDDIFSRSMRIQLLMSILQDKPVRGGADINLQQFYLEGKIDAFYPLHDKKQFREKLGQRILATARPWLYPLQDIREYFGEKIGLYVAYVCHFATWSLLPALVGIGCQVALLWDKMAYSSDAFGLLVSLWGVLALEYWKRQEKTLSMKWGTTGVESSDSLQDHERASFYGTEMLSYVDGSEIQYFEPKLARRRKAISSFLLMISGCIMLYSGALYYARAQTLDKYKGDTSQVGLSVVNAVLIVFFSFVARFISRWLAEMENHRTDKDFEASYVSKLFVLTFINCFSSLFYIAFGAKYLSKYFGVDGETEFTYDASYNTAINLTVIFAVRYIFLGIVRTSAPWAKHWIVKFWRSKKKCRATVAFIRWFFCSALKKFCCRYICCNVDLAYSEDTYDYYSFEITAKDRVAAANHLKTKRINERRNPSHNQSAEEQQVQIRDDDRELELNDLSLDDKEEDVRQAILSFSPAEKEYRMSTFDLDGAPTRYLEQVMIFGFMTFFVSALPASFALGFVSMTLELRGEMWLMLHRLQRPLPQKVENMGPWREIMALMVILAGCTNAAVVIFTMPTFDTFTDFQRMGIFVLFQYCVFLSQYMLQVLIPDVPEEVKIQLQRQEFIASKIIERQPDVDLDPLSIL